MGDLSIRIISHCYIIQYHIISYHGNIASYHDHNDKSSYEDLLQIQIQMKCKSNPSRKQSQKSD